MINLVVRPAARGDIADIWLYTADQWGTEQADAYVDQIKTTIARALSRPQTGGSVSGLPSVYRKLRSGSHRIIYRLADSDLIVVRVLHERQDVPDEIDDD